MRHPKLAKRRDGVGPVFVGSYRPGDKIEHSNPAPGHVATLRINDVEILVRITAAEGGSFSGRVIGFENLDALEYEGLTVNGEVEFGFDNVMSVMT